MIVQVVLDVQDSLDVFDGRRVGLALLHEREMAIPGPGVSVESIVLGFHEISPSVVFNLGGSDKIKTIDGGGTAEDLSAGPVEGAVTGIWLRDGVVPPVVGGVQQRMCPGVAGND